MAQKPPTTPIVNACLVLGCVVFIAAFGYGIGVGFDQKPPWWIALSLGFFVCAFVGELAAKQARERLTEDAAAKRSDVR